MLGSTAVGKSTLLQQFVASQFEEAYTPTPPGGTTLHTSCSLNGHIYHFRLLDMPAIREFPANSLAEWTEYQTAELRTAHAYVFVFDLSTPASFYYVKGKLGWDGDNKNKLKSCFLPNSVLRDQLFDSRNMSNVPVWVVGNKADLCMNVLATMRSHRHDHHHHPHHTHPHTHHPPPHPPRHQLLHTTSHHYHHYHQSTASPYEDILPAFKDLANLVRKQWKCSYLECSAKYNWRILPIFREIVKSLEAELVGGQLAVGGAGAGSSSGGRDSQLGRQSSPRPADAAGPAGATPSSSNRYNLLPLPPPSASPSDNHHQHHRHRQHPPDNDGTASRGICRIA